MACVNNLKHVGLAFRVWDGDAKDGFPMRYATNAGGTQQYITGGNAFRHFQIMSNELDSDVKILVCPADNRLAAKDFTSLTSSNVSYFVAVDAAEEYPQMPLSGNRNLTTNGIELPSGLAMIASSANVGWSGEIHRNVGNVCMSDGSVQQFAFIKLIPSQISTSNSLRLAIP